MGKDFRLKKDSDCIVGDLPNTTRTKKFAPKPVRYEYDFKTGNWVLKTHSIALGAIG
jgi:hypothetical protein